MFKKVLIANRGEIACRIARALRQEGISPVAVHHVSEALSRHVRAADEAVEISGDTPVAAHLDIDQIVAAARAAGVEAVHPGYGFLSENAAFARAVNEAGMTFIGPEPETIARMGDKIEARVFAAGQGIPVAPSAMLTGDQERFLADASAIGFPLLIKAAAGGGGKGMSIVRKPEELADQAHHASAEAARYFGDGRVYAELYIERPRHIEVQVLGDGTGTVVHLFERECSVQRRFQKLIEEAPAPRLNPEVRASILDAAVRLAAAARYRNAGTVEFILAPDGRFFFLEMNTRLQVEHSVTEMVTGVDLVRAQLAIAAGRGLPFTQDELWAEGHAIECRICAEDAENGFLPETGKLLKLCEPAGADIRFESGLSEGQRVTSDFDPMLAKLVAHGADRSSAIRACRQALEDTVLLGVQTNADYLHRLLGSPAFAAGDLHTAFVSEHAAALRAPSLPDPERRRILLAAAHLFREFQVQAFGTPEPHASMGGWRN